MEPARPRNAARLFMGLVIVALGTFALLDALGVLEFADPWRFWPLILVAVGLSKMLGPTGSHERWVGLALVLVGSWILARTLGLWPYRLRDFFLPGLALFVGAWLIWGALRRTPPRSVEPDTSGRLHAFAVLSGTEHRSGSADFRGGEATAVLGSCKIDLLDAQVQGGETVLDVFAALSSIEVVVPRDWTVVAQVTPVLGSFEDKTRPTPQAAGPRLVVRGTVILGSVEVKN